MSGPFTCHTFKCTVYAQPLIVRNSLYFLLQGKNSQINDFHYKGINHVFTLSSHAKLDHLELCEKPQMTNGTKHPFTSPFKMQVGTTTALTHAPVYEQSQLGAAADYLLIK